MTDPHGARAQTGARPAASTAHRPVRRMLGALAAAVVVLTALLEIDHREVPEPIGIAAAVVFVGATTSVTEVLRRRLATAAAAGGIGWRAQQRDALFLAAGLWFTYLAVAAPFLALTAGLGTYELQVREPRGVALLAIAALALVVGAASAVRGLVVWIRTWNSGSAPRIAYEAGAGLAVQLWALISLYGAFFILYPPL